MYVVIVFSCVLGDEGMRKITILCMCVLTVIHMLLCVFYREACIKTDVICSVGCVEYVYMIN